MVDDTKHIIFGVLSGKPAAFALVLVIVLAVTAVLHASGGPTMRHGTIAARGMVRGPNGQPFWAEYNDDGEVVSEIGEAHGDTLGNARVISGVTYQSYVATFRSIESANRPNYEILYRETYETTL